MTNLDIQRTLGDLLGQFERARKNMPVSLELLDGARAAVVIGGKATVLHVSRVEPDPDPRPLPEVLCAWLREHSQFTTSQPRDFTEWVIEDVGGGMQWVTAIHSNWPASGQFCDGQLEGVILSSWKHRATYFDVVAGTNHKTDDPAFPATPPTVWNTHNIGIPALKVE